MSLFKNRLQSIRLIQLILGMIAIVFVIVGWAKDLHPGYMLVGIIILAVMMVMNGMEQYFIYKKKAYLCFTIIVGGLFSLFWIWYFFSR